MKLLSSSINPVQSLDGQRAARSRSSGRLARVGLILTLLSFLPGQLLAHQPMRPGEYEHLVEHGLLEDRISFVESLGNDKMADHLVERVQNNIAIAQLEAQGASEEEIEAAEIQNALPTPGPLPNLGRPNTLTLLLDFADFRSSVVAPALTIPAIEANIYGTGTAVARANHMPFESLNAFWKRASENLLDIQGNVLGWYNFPNVRSTYEPPDASQPDRQYIFDMVREALDFYDARGHDFSQYDNDGDGDIDAIQIMWTGPDNGWANFWWAYRWTFAGLPDATNTRWDGVNLRDFTWQFLDLREGESDLNPRVLCHEMGHMLGLPDLYDYTPGQNLLGGVGGVDIMDSNRGNPNAFFRWALDWISPAVVSNEAPTGYTLRAASDLTVNDDKAVAIFPGLTNSAVDQEFFIVENRHRIGNDEGPLSNMPSDGLMVWHIDSEVLGGGFRHSNADRFADSERKLVRLVQADGLEEIELDEARADRGDYFVQGDEFTPTSNPNTNDYEGTATQISLSNISISSEVMTAEIGFLGGREQQSNALIIDPEPGSVIPDQTATFTWSEGVGALAYFLTVGSSPGATDIHSSGVLPPEQFSQLVTGIPTVGARIYARMWTQHPRGWSSVNYTFTGGEFRHVRSEVVSPAPSAILNGSLTLAWDEGSGGTGYWVSVGTSPGLSNIHSSGQLEATQRAYTISNMPTDGSIVYVRLYTQFGDFWESNDYEYIAGPDSSAAEITSPVGGTSIRGPVAQFEWNAGGGATGYWLNIGTTQGGSNIHNSGLLGTSVFSQLVNNLPVTESTVYVRFWTRVGADWYFRDYTYAATNVIASRAEMTSPANGATVGSDIVTFQWNPGDAGLAYWLSVGTSQGASNIYSSGSLGAELTELAVGGLPRDGSVFHVRLWTQHPTGWVSEDYQYTSAILPVITRGSMESPVNGRTLSGSTATFQWSSGVGANAYWVSIGDQGAGSSNLAQSGLLSAATLEYDMAGLPLDGRTLNVRLWTRHGAQWGYTDFTYRAATVAPSRAVLTSHRNNDTLPATTVEFTWDPGNHAVRHYVYVGSEFGLFDIHSSGHLASTTTRHIVSGLPSNGTRMFMTLWTDLGTQGGWVYNTYMFYGATVKTKGEITLPSPDGTLISDSAMFEWTQGGGAEGYYLFAGSRPGGADYFASGSIDAGESDLMVNGLPSDGSRVYVRFYTLHDFTWSWNDYQYDAFISGAQIESPFDGGILNDRNVTFFWDQVEAASGYSLTVGSAARLFDYYSSGSLGAETTSHRATNLPSDGSPLYVTLWTRSPSGGLIPVDHQYTAATLTQSNGMITSPAPDSTLTEDRMTLEWDAGLLADEYMVYVGSTPGGSMDIFSSGLLGQDVLSLEVTKIPTDGSQFYVTLWTRHGATWSSEEYTYTSATLTPEKAQLTSPTPGSIFTTDSVRFVHDGGVAALDYYLYVGTERVGTYNIYKDYFSEANRSKLVAGIPGGSQTIYVRLWTQHAAGWTFEDYTFTSSDVVGQTNAIMINPAPDTTLTSSTETFTWTAGEGALAYYVSIGSAQGGGDYGVSGVLSASSLSWIANGLPDDGGGLWVRLWTQHASGWSFNDYQYTAWNSFVPPELITPVPGSTLQGGYEWFGWNSNGADVEKWILDVGTSAGQSDLRFSEVLDAAVTSETVVGIPEDGSDIYVTLWYRIAGVWAKREYTYVAATVAADDVGGTRTNNQDLGDDPTWANDQMIETAYDVDLYRVNLTTRSYLDVNTTGTTDTVGYIMNAGGVIIESDNDSGDNENFAMSEALNPGEYYIAVRSYGTTTGDYRLDVISRAIPNFGDGVDLGPDSVSNGVRVEGSSNGHDSSLRYRDR